MATANDVKEMDKSSEAILQGLNQKTTTIDFEESANKVRTALDAISGKESIIGTARLDQLANVKTVFDEIGAVSAIFFKKSTAQTTRDTILESFHVTVNGKKTRIFSEAKNQSEALEIAFKASGLTLTTAKNLRDLEKVPALVKLCKDGYKERKLHVSAAYTLSRAKGLSEADYRKALICGVTPTDTKAWIEAWQACKDTVAQWNAYAAAESAKDTDKMDLAWVACMANLKSSETPDFPNLLATYDPKAARVILAEREKRATAAAAALEEAKKRQAEWEAELKRKQKVASQAEASADKATLERQEAVNKAKELAARIEAKKAELETASEDAIKAIRSQLAELTQQGYAANQESEQKQAEERRLAQLARERKEAVKAAESKLEEAKDKVTETETETRQNMTEERPKAQTFESLRTGYLAMTAEQINTELVEISAALKKAGKLAEWAAYGRGIELALVSFDD